MTQLRLAELVGISRPRVAEIERGQGGSAPLATWIALGIVLKRPLAVSFSRAMVTEPQDAGHLAIQELVVVSRDVVDSVEG
jgi:transcriptional regulator with XRE-family HTH domain